MQGLQLPFGYNFCIQGIQLLSCSNHQCPELDGCAGRGQHLLAPFDYSLSGGSTVSYATAFLASKVARAEQNTYLGWVSVYR